MKRVLVIWSVLVLGAIEAQARLITVESFEDFIGGTKFVEIVEMAADYEAETTDNLMIRDPATGEDSIVSGQYYMGFIQYKDNNAYVVGYGKNYDIGYPEWAGRMTGVYVQYTKSNGVTTTIMATGHRPDDIWFIHDGNEDGIGTYNTATAAWTLGEDDILYTSEDILFGEDQIRGDVGQLPTVGGESSILPHMVISVVPEPASLALLALGSLFLRKR